MENGLSELYIEAAWKLPHTDVNRCKLLRLLEGTSHHIARIKCLAELNK